MIEGVNVKLGEREFIIPPVPFSAVRRNPCVFDGSKQADMLEMADILLATIQRNYPDVTAEELDRHLDAVNFREAFAAAMGASRMEPKAPGEVEAGSQ